MIISISQPTYLPWLGYFELIQKADVFVFLDSVQFEKQSWQSRNRIKNPKGELFWLSVPVSRGSLSTPIKDIGIATERKNWSKKHLNTIKQCLSKANFFPEAECLLAECYGMNPESLAELNIAIVKATSLRLGIETEFLRSSELGLPGRRGELLRSICQHLGATTYYSNAGSACYLEEERQLFRDVNVDLVFQGWPHPEYRQLGTDFVSHLSFVDAVANIGLEGTAEIIRSSITPHPEPS